MQDSRCEGDGAGDEVLCCVEGSSNCGLHVEEVWELVEIG